MVAAPASPFPDRNAGSDLRMRLVHEYSADHVQGHVFLCVLALYVEWHMRRLALMLSGDDYRDAIRLGRGSPVGPVNVPDSAVGKASMKRTADGLVHSLGTLPGDPAALTLNGVTLSASPDHAVSMPAKPTRPGCGLRAPEGRSGLGCCHVTATPEPPDFADPPLLKG